MPVYKGHKYKDFRLPGGTYFSQLSEDQQERLIEWAVEKVLPAILRLALYYDQAIKEDKPHGPTPV